MIRRFPHVTVRKLSPFYSSRNGTKPRLIVIHATESHNYPGDRDLAAIGEWFQNPAAQVSSHVCTDGDGNSARYVRDYEKAWHCAGFNSVSLGIEQIGSTTDTWNRAEVRETARWVALWSRKHGIPIRQGQVNQQGAVIRSGIVRHSDLGARGGNHDDPGNNYPWALLLGLARYYKVAQMVAIRKKNP